MGLTFVTKSQKVVYKTVLESINRRELCVFFSFLLQQRLHTIDRPTHIRMTPDTHHYRSWIVYDWTPSVIRFPKNVYNWRSYECFLDIPHTLIIGIRFLLLWLCVLFVIVSLSVWLIQITEMMKGYLSRHLTYKHWGFYDTTSGLGVTLPTPETLH